MTRPPDDHRTGRETISSDDRSPGEARPHAHARQADPRAANEAPGEAATAAKAAGAKAPATAKAATTAPHAHAPTMAAATMTATAAMAAPSCEGGQGQRNQR